ncbi:MAG: methyltransferase domain-containing protein [Chloroflexi bacterium]|nr:methyltransferase domain-containing protein [Chloroflexota bacterium]
MPRQQLNRFHVRKPSPAQLEKYLTDYPEETLVHSEISQISPNSLFGEAKPLVVDFGCGRGRFTVAQAAQHRDTNFVGIDVSSKSLWDAVHQATKLNLANIGFIRADLRWLMPYVVDGSIAEAYIMFPKPHKTKTKKQDFFTAQFIEDLHRCLIPDGYIQFVTDHDELFKAKNRLFEESGLFQVEEVSQGIEGGFTRYQEIWEQYGVTSKRGIFRVSPPTLRPSE